MAVDLVHGFLGGDVFELFGDFLHFLGGVFEHVLQGNDHGAVFGEGFHVDDVEVPFAGGQQCAALVADGGVDGCIRERIEGSRIHNS